MSGPWTSTKTIKWSSVKSCAGMAAGYLRLLPPVDTERHPREFCEPYGQLLLVVQAALDVVAQGFPAKAVVERLEPFFVVQDAVMAWLNRLGGGHGAVDVDLYYCYNVVSGAIVAVHALRRPASEMCRERIYRAFTSMRKHLGMLGVSREDIARAELYWRARDAFGVDPGLVSEDVRLAFEACWLAGEQSAARRLAHSSRHQQPVD